MRAAEAPASLYQLLDPEVLADPYPLYRRLREDDPVHWDPYLHAWVVTRYEDVVTVFQRFLADRTPPPETPRRRSAWSELSPIAAVMVRQMLFLDPPEHGRVRAPRRRWPSPPGASRRLREHIQQIAEVLDRPGSGRRRVRT